MNHALFVKKYDQHDYDIGLLQSKHLGVWWWLWGQLHALASPLWVILRYLRLIPSCNAIKTIETVFTSLDEVLAWYQSLWLRLIREYVWEKLHADRPLL
jgi:hypothetical protein